MYYRTANISLQTRKLKKERNYISNRHHYLKTHSDIRFFMLWSDARSSCSCSSSQSGTLLSSVQQPPACSATRGSLASQSLGQFLEPFFQLQGEFLVTLLTNGLHVKLNKFVPAERKRIVTVSQVM